MVCFGKSLFDHQSEKLPQIEVSLIPRIKTNLEGYTNGTAMFERLKLLVEKNSLRRSTTYTQDLQDFKAGVGQVVASDIQMLLPKTCSGPIGLHEFADALLERGVDPNYCPENSSLTPALAAAYRGFAECLKVLHKHHADFTIVKKQTDETILHRLLICLLYTSPSPRAS